MFQRCFDFINHEQCLWFIAVVHPIHTNFLFSFLLLYVCRSWFAFQLFTFSLPHSIIPSIYTMSIVRTLILISFTKSAFLSLICDNITLSLRFIHSIECVWMRMSLRMSVVFTFFMHQIDAKYIVSLPVKTFQ